MNGIISTFFPASTSRTASYLPWQQMPDDTILADIEKHRDTQASEVMRHLNVMRYESG